jgi:membrane associated rhomboid family serine protease
MPTAETEFRSHYRRESTPVVTWLASALAGAFLLQFVASLIWPAATTRLADELSFSIDGIASGLIWTPATHWLVHSTTNLFHVGLVLAGIVLFGRELVILLSPRRLVAVFGAGIVAGAIAWAALNWRDEAGLCGAAAGVYALGALYALLYPNREFNFLVLFLFPVKVRVRQVAALLLLLESLAFVICDILEHAIPFSYAPAAHLGGVVAGWVYYQFFHEFDWRSAQRGGAAVRPTAVTGSAGFAPPPAARPNSASRPTPRDLRAETDRILDKINREGLGALTSAERRVLEQARASLSRR